MNAKSKILNQGKLTSTEEYIRENEYVMSLKRRVLKGRPRMKYKSTFLRVLLKCYKVIKNCVVYIFEIIKYRKEFVEIKRMKGFKENYNALVIGNGPSQGYLTPELINNFKKKGGEVFAVNFWQLNKQLSSVAPNYLVISDPATLSFDPAYEDLKCENLSLLLYLQNNENIKIACPFSRVKELEKTFKRDRIFCFSDTELLGVSSNITPIYPRGYISMTLLKALALALWFGYKSTYVIGMDNTYPRNIFCDLNNKILNLEKHAGTQDVVVDQSAIYRNISELLEDLSALFRDILKFSQSGEVINLDEYSLTDAFSKLKIEDFEKQILSDKAF